MIRFFYTFFKNFWIGNITAIKHWSKTFFLEKIPVVLKKSYKMEAFVFCHPVYKETWTQRCNRLMLRTNMLLQFFMKEKRRSLVIFPSESRKSLQIFVFYFLQTAIENRCQIIVYGKVVNQNDGLGMKVPSWLLITAKEKIINILIKKKTSKIFCCNYIVKESGIKRIKPNLFPFAQSTIWCFKIFEGQFFGKI